RGRPQGSGRHGDSRLVGRLPRRRQLPVSIVLFGQRRAGRELRVLRGRRDRLAHPRRPPDHGRGRPHGAVPTHRRSRVRRRAEALPLVPQGPVGPPARRERVGPAGDLQRSALDPRPDRGGGSLMRLVARRLVMTLPTLFGVLVVAFLLLNVAPGDPVAAMVGERADSATIARLRAELHLDDPLPAQFGRYLWGVVRLDLGRSYITQRPIAEDLAARFPKTVQLALAAMLIAALSGITLGVLSAIRPGGAVDRLAMLVSYLGVSFPVYWVGLLLILVFAVVLRWLPPSGSGGLAYLVLPAVTLGSRSLA